MTNRGEKRWNPAVSSGWLGRLLIAVLAFLAAEAGPIGGLPDTSAQSAGSLSSVPAMQGEVTARQGYDIRINNRAYTLHRDVVIKDEVGQPKTLADLSPGTMVTFQTRQGQIHAIIVMLPR
jgi:hypothetical protein